MKFGKSLSNQIEGAFPEWRDKFLSYKELKKKLKLIGAGSASRSSKRLRLNDGESRDMDLLSDEEIDFTVLLEAELAKFNGFFLEKQEEYVIIVKELEGSVERAKESNEELIRIRKEIVDFHGEMVLLENYSAFNFTGLVKILKKYDKRTGALIRLPFIQKVLQQPFFMMDVLYNLIKKCESMLDHLFPISETSVPSDDDGDANPVSTSNDELLETPKQLTEIGYIESLYMKSAVLALQNLKEIRSGSSTVSAFSLPPLQSSSVLEKTWNKIPVLEQVAK